MVLNVVQRARQFLIRRSLDYIQTFESGPGERVLVDLAKFCRAHETSFHSDPRVNAVLEGRREVWLRIQHHLNLSNDKLWDLYDQRPEYTETDE